MAGLSARPIGMAAAAARRAADHTNSKSNGSTSKASHRQETSKKPARNGCAADKAPEPIGRAGRASGATKRLLRTIGRNGPAARCDGPEAEYNRQDRSQAKPSQRVLQMVIRQGDHELSGLR